MEIKGRKIQKRYLFVAALVALVIPRCVQMNMEETALKEKLAAGGFDNEYEMESIVGSGFTTKAEFEQFVRTTPIPSSEGESTVQCAAVASFWEDRELSLKTNVGDLTPKTIRSVMNSDLIYNYAVGKTTNSILTARRDHLVKQLEAQFEKEGVSDSLKSKYLDCHAKFGPYVEKKCGATGVCEESTELVGLDGKPISGRAAPEGGVAQSSLDGLSTRYPQSKVLIYLNDKIISAETCELFRRVSGWQNESACMNNRNDWKLLCLNATAAQSKLLELPAKEAGMTGGSSNTEEALLSVARNGGAELIGTTWGESDDPPCRMTVEYSGLYEGSTVKETLTGQVKGIAIMPDGGVVLAY